MANCCEEKIFCNKLVTVGDLEKMISAATLDCSDYNSGGSISYLGCCSNLPIPTSGYSPTYYELICSHEFVDLGLPSGTKWATMNVGASSETDYGNYYQYGKGARTYQETSGDSSGYTGIESPLPATADTATVKWGGKWHMPTQSQVQEIFSGISSGTITSGFSDSDKVYYFRNRYNNNELVIPTAGWYGKDGGSDVANLHDNGERGLVWTSTLEYVIEDVTGTAVSFDCVEENGVKIARLNGAKRACGISVSPVIDSNIWVHNWVKGSYGYDDEDGFKIEQGWISAGDCCSGDTNVPLSAVSFLYSTYSGFSLSDVSCDVCTNSGTSTFNYGVNRNKVVCEGDGFKSEIDSAITLSNSDTSLTLGDIISAISISQSSTATEWTDFSGFTSATLGNVKIDSVDIFTPQFVSTVNTIESDCSGANITLEEADAYIHIMPKFRSCPKDSMYYHAHRDSEEISFEWVDENSESQWEVRDEYQRIVPIGYSYLDCENDIKRDEAAGVMIVYGRYTTGSYNPRLISAWTCDRSETDCQDEIEFDEGEDDEYIGTFGGDEIIRFKSINDDDNTYLVMAISDDAFSTEFSRKIYICVALEDTCGNTAQTCCSVCLEKISTPVVIQGSCCTGLLNKFPTLDCSMTLENSEAMARPI